MSKYGNYDINSWTPGFVSSHRDECLRMLRLLISVIMDLIREKNYPDALKGLQQLALGLIKLENGNLGDFGKQHVLLALLIPTVAIFGLLDGDVPESRRRDAALLYAFEITDDPNHELAACYPIAKDMIWSYIADLRAGIPLAQFNRKYNLPADIFDTLESVDHDLSSLSFASSPSVSSSLPSTYAASSRYSAPSRHAAPRASKSSAPSRGRGWSVLLIIVIIGVLAFFARPYISGWQSASPDAAQQSEAPAEETPEPEPVLQDSGFIFPDSDTLVIGQGEIEALSDSELTYAINEIYARHGYIFKSAELRGYYEQFSWYSGEVPSDEFSVDCFNQIEQQNWTLLVGERDRRKAAG